MRDTSSSIVLVLAAVIALSANGWSKCADRTIAISGTISGDNIGGLTLALAILSNSSDAKWEGVRQDVFIHDHNFTIKGYFNPTEGGVDGICSRRPVLVSVFLKHGDQKLDAKRFEIEKDFKEDDQDQTYELTRPLIMQAKSR